MVRIAMLHGLFNGLFHDEAVKPRSVDQNRMYFRRLGEISDQAWFNGKQYSSEGWHHYSKWHIMTDEVELKDGTIVSKLVETPDGKLDVISTTKLSVRCFANYITLVEVFGASDLNVKFSANNNDRGY